ncbi:hypothetical protein B0H34DRAFT_792686 [Crassisporium funariophilum]|nr:hypothetical protein B0H34DRAFT_792686 [Crassisporium funariophilum]
MHAYHPETYQYTNVNMDFTNLIVAAIPESFDFYSAQGPPFTTNSLLQQNDGSQAQPLYAPAPLPGQTASLYSGLQVVDSHQPHNHSYYSEPRMDEATSRALCEPQQSDIDLEYCGQNALQSTFPTPSELLAELAANGLSATSDDFGSDVRAESARKARRRAMAKSVGFVPTDPDSISSHEKKRHYLECLEQYVQFLHQQLELIGSTPVELVRVPSHRGLSSRSIRTLLVHMENTTRHLNNQTLTQEERFVALRDLVYKRQSSSR